MVARRPLVVASGVECEIPVGDVETVDATNVATEFTTTTPPSPTFGVTHFSRKNGKSRAAYVDPRGLDTVVQEHTGRNVIGWLAAVPGSANPQVSGGMAATILSNAGTSGTAVTQAPATSFFAGRARFRVTTTTTAGTGLDVRTPAMFYLSSVAHDGGFDIMWRWGMATSISSQREFVGLINNGSALSATVEPSTFLNMIGVGCDSGDTNLQIMFNDGSGTASKIDLGSFFPGKTSSTDFYEFGLYSPSGGGLVVDWYIRRLNDGALAQGTLTTNLPAVNTMLAAHNHGSNNATATAVAMDIQRIYFQTDN